MTLNNNGVVIPDPEEDYTKDVKKVAGKEAEKNAKQKALAEQVQLRVIDYPTHAPLGQFTTPTAIRSNVTGMLSTPELALWNVEKK